MTECRQTKCAKCFPLFAAIETKCAKWFLLFAAIGVFVAVVVTPIILYGAPIPELQEKALRHKCSVLERYVQPKKVEWIKSVKVGGFFNSAETHFMMVFDPNWDVETSRGICGFKRTESQTFYVLRAIMSPICASGQHNRDATINFYKKQNPGKNSTNNLHSGLPIFLDIGSRTGWFAFHFSSPGCFSFSYEARPLVRLLPKLNQCLNPGWPNAQVIPAFPLDIQHGKDIGAVHHSTSEVPIEFKDIGEALLDVQNQRQMFRDIISQGNFVNIVRPNNNGLYHYIDPTKQDQFPITVDDPELNFKATHQRDHLRGSDPDPHAKKEIKDRCVSVPVIDMKQELDRVTNMIANHHIAAIRIDPSMNLPLVWSGLHSYAADGRIQTIVFRIEPLTQGVEWLEKTIGEAIKTMGYHFYELPFTTLAKPGRCRFREIHASKVQKSIQSVFKRYHSISDGTLDVMLTKHCPMDLARLCDEAT